MRKHVFATWNAAGKTIPYSNIAAALQTNQTASRASHKIYKEIIVNRMTGRQNIFRKYVLQLCHRKTGLSRDKSEWKSINFDVNAAHLTQAAVIRNPIWNSVFTLDAKWSHGMKADSRATQQRLHHHKSIINNYKVSLDKITVKFVCIIRELL